MELLQVTRVHHKNQLFTPNLIRLLNKTGPGQNWHVPLSATPCHWAILELDKSFLQLLLAFRTGGHMKLTFCSLSLPRIWSFQIGQTISSAFTKIECHPEMVQANKCPKAFRAGPETVLLRSKSDRSWCLLTPSRDRNARYAVIAWWRATFCADGGAKPNLQISFRKSWN